jgi:hypothetical protein
MCTVEGGSINFAEVSIGLGPGIISSVSWRGDYLIAGDSMGNIYVWSWSKKKLRQDQ